MNTIIIIRTRSRQVWYWVNFVFNRVDRSRVEAFGPDRAAAEWILRLGGSVKFKGTVHLEAIQAQELAITSNGLEHLEGLCYLKSLSVSRCKYLYDEGLALLHHVQETLQLLDLSHCTGLSTKGLHHITSLKNLEELNIMGIKGAETTRNMLLKSLPNCKIIA